MDSVKGSCFVLLFSGFYFGDDCYPGIGLCWRRFRCDIRSVTYLRGGGGGDPPRAALSGGRQKRGRGEEKGKGRKKEKKEKEREREIENLNLNLFLFYNGYKLGRMPLFIWPLIQNYNLSTTEKYSSN